MILIYIHYKIKEMEEDPIENNAKKDFSDNNEAFALKSAIYEVSTVDESEITENDQYEITFHYNQALTALVIHFIHIVFGTFSLPLLYKLFGRTLCTNMYFALKKYYLSELYS